MRLGLVIQGPTRSVGLTPAGWAARHQGREVLNGPPHVLDYDVWPALNEMLGSHGHLFTRKVLVTWEGDPVQEVAGLEILALPPVADEPTQKQSLKRSLGLPVNKHRQFLTSYTGFQHLKAAGDVDAVLRIRTDITLDLGAVAEWMIVEIGREDNQAVYAPALGYPALGLTDFFFLGRLQPLWEFFDLLNSDPSLECASSVHADLLLKPVAVAAKRGGQANLSRLGRAPFPLTLDPEYAPAPTLDLLRRVLGKGIRVLPRWMSESMTWRGQPVATAPLESIWPEHVYAEGFDDVLAALFRPRPPHLLRGLLDRAFDYETAARWSGRSSVWDRARTASGRAILRLAYSL